MLLVIRVVVNCLVIFCCLVLSGKNRKLMVKSSSLMIISVKLIGLDGVMMYVIVFSIEIRVLIVLMMMCGVLFFWRVVMRLVMDSV